MVTPFGSTATSLCKLVQGLAEQHLDVGVRRLLQRVRSRAHHPLSGAAHANCTGETPRGREREQVKSSQVAPEGKGTSRGLMTDGMTD